MKKERTELIIVDYGVGNLQSLRKAFATFGVEPLVSEDPEIIASAGRLVLPGVGSFEAGMRGLRLRGLLEVVKRHAAENKPLLGICLGAQLLFSRGLEFGEHEGLGIIKGSVIKFPELPEKEKIPQVGWNRVLHPESVSWKGTVLHGLEQKCIVYFVHSYILKPEDTEQVLGETTYGGFTFCSAVRKGNVYGTQFHPEKSGTVGLEIVKNFVTLVN